MKLHTLAALLASTIAAAAVAAPSTATSTLPPGVKDMSPDQIDYNLQAIDAAAKEQQELARQKEAARAAAEEALIEQRIIMADPQAYQEFLARLDQAPAPNAALRKTMQTPAPWEQEE